ncbi:MAG: ATP-binding protein, partial [Saprospiraceae bacterium]|nr:ATP-binding protein [Saprospiraceae bacterium]
MELIGRKEEKRALEMALASNRAELVAVIGRRRVGKTFLVRSVYGSRIVFEISGLQKGNTKAQLQNFALALRYSGLDDAMETPRNWMQAFFDLSRLIEQRAYREKVVLFFDEFPWLATRRSDFLQGFSFFWNSWAVKKNVVVVICGSAASWMIHKVINDRGGLHNRVTRLLHLAPFNLREAEQFLHARGIYYPHFQTLELYLALGGIPMYLELLEPGLSPTENIHRLCFEPSGYLRQEFQNLYAALFERCEAHIAVVRALAAKRQGMNREALLRATKLTDGGAFSQVLDELTLSGFIGRFGAYGKKKRDAVYRLIDAYSLFYLNFIEEALLNPTA